MAAGNPPSLGNRKIELAMRYRGADGLCDVLCFHQAAYLMVAWTEAALLAGEGDECLVAEIAETMTSVAVLVPEAVDALEVRSSRSESITTE